MFGLKSFKKYIFLFFICCMATASTNNLPAQPPSGLLGEFFHGRCLGGVGACDEGNFPLNLIIRTGGSASGASSSQ